MPRTYLVTGASDGIGLEVARLAIANGAAVLMVARDAIRLQAAANRLPGPVRPRIAAVDLADAAALDQFLAGLDAEGFVPDVLVNNAGHGASGAFADADWAKLDAMLRLNMHALARLSHWAARGMKARGSGAIVNLSAIAQVTREDDGRQRVRLREHPEVSVEGTTWTTVLLRTINAIAAGMRNTG
jgi:short-subunit dehydrogenase